MRHTSRPVARLRVAARAFTRLLVAVVLAFVAIMSVPMMASAAATSTIAGPHLAAGLVDPDREATLEIHKFTQPVALGAPATGLPQDTTGLTPVRGAGFTARLVPGIDLTTDAGMAAAGALTPAEAAVQVAGQPSAGTTTTNAAGRATLTGLRVGLYYVEETTTPAGFVSAAPFLVALPLTNPQVLNERLWTVHAYPKNAPVGITLNVNDADAVALGDAVSWTARAVIPVHTSLDGYRIDLEINSRLRLIGGAAGVTVTLDCGDAGACPALQSGTHFTVSTAGGSPVSDFTAAGLALLETTVAAHPFATVVVAYDTEVLAMGDLTSTATLSPSRATIEGQAGAAPTVSDNAATRWGPLSIIVHEVGHPDRRIPGAEFQLFLTADDAARGANPVSVAGVSRWTSDANGEVVINGLRFSAFVDGLERDPTSPLFREYFVSLVRVPVGYEGDAQVGAVQVNSTTEPAVVIMELRRVTTGPGEPGGPGPGPDEPGLSLTGAQVTGATVLAVLLLVAGWLLVAARRRKTEHEQP